MEKLMDSLQSEEEGGRHINFDDPGPLPEKLTKVPGFISELADWTMQHGRSPNRTLAFTGALAMLAHLAGRTYADRSGTRTNLYLIVLGLTGIGKDDPRTTNKRLAERLGWSQSIIESFASGESLEDAIVEMPSLFFLPDEVASLFGQMRGQGRAAKSFSERMRRLFTSSASEYKPRKKATVGKGGSEAQCLKSVLHPHLTIFGTGVPEEMFDSLTPQEVRNGLFGRCLVMTAQDENVRQEADAFVAFPKRILEVGEMLVKQEKDAQDSGILATKVVPATDEAAETKSRVMEILGAHSQRLKEADLMNAHAIVARIGEKIGKLALIYAISENPYAPKITRAAVEWATAFSLHVVREMLYEAQFHLAEGKFGKLMERAKAIMSRNGGQIERRPLLQKLRCDVTLFKRLIKKLLVAEEIEEPSEIDGKIVFRLAK